MIAQLQCFSPLFKTSTGIISSEVAIYQIWKGKDLWVIRGTFDVWSALLLSTKECAVPAFVRLH